MTGQPMTKLFYKIGEVSKLASVEPYILRYWESEFPMLAPRKNRGGQRVYQDKDLDMVLDIKRMLHEEGYTIAGARKKLSEPGRGARVKAASPGKLSEVAVPTETQTVSVPPPGTQLDMADILNPPQSPFDKRGSRRQGDSELADALGRFKDEIKGILDLLS